MANFVNSMKNLVLKHRIQMALVVIIIATQSCQNHQDKATVNAAANANPPKKVIVKRTFLAKESLFPRSAASFCRPTDLPRSDSAIFMNGGGREFKETIANTQATPVT